MQDEQQPKPRRRGPDKKPRKSPAGPGHAGPGRPKGSKNVLPQGSVGAIKALRWRVPDEAPEPVKEVADEAFDTVVEIMRGSGGRHSLARLTAARTVREEVCGPVQQKVAHEHTGAILIGVIDPYAEPPTEGEA